MTITAQQVLERARFTLNDAENTRWTLPELALYLNDAVREIALHKPNAVSKTVEISLDEGTYQSHTFIALIRVIRNLATVEADPQGRTGGSAITPIERPILDATMPGWQNPSVLPFAATVDHVIQDMADPRAFYVVPGNDGTGVIEAIVAQMPAEIETPANPFLLESYTAVVELPDIYRNALTDYVLYRSYAKDAEDPSLAARATKHFEMFATSIGLKMQRESVANLRTTGET